MLFVIAASAAAIPVGTLAAGADGGQCGMTACDPSVGAVMLTPTAVGLGALMAVGIAWFAVRWRNGDHGWPAALGTLALVVVGGYVSLGIWANAVGVNP